MEGESYSSKYYVIFEDSSLDDWRIKYLQPNFSHVSLAKKSVNGYFWTVISPKSGNITIDMVPDGSLREYYPEAVIIPFRSIVNKKPQVTLCLSTCVEVAKAVLGIRKWWIITPYQLYKYIAK